MDTDNSTFTSIYSTTEFHFNEKDEDVPSKYAIYILIGFLILILLAIIVLICIILVICIKDKIQNRRRNAIYHTDRPRRRRFRRRRRSRNSSLSNGSESYDSDNSYDNTHNTDDEESILSFKPIKKIPSKIKEDAINTGSCCICLEEFDKNDISDITFSNCNHIFHIECIEKWNSKNDQDFTCPICRNKEVILFQVI